MIVEFRRQIVLDDAAPAFREFRFGEPSDGISSTLDGSTGTDGAGPEPKTDREPTPEPPVPGSSTSEPDSEDTVEEAASLEKEKEGDDNDEPDGSPFRDLNI
ncbi:hypothetical protein GWG54_17400 [Natronococcus sp. JC468]|uniref:hypothetical protein n=1 Tax=Natronococcus sp. JC468 TaxID=1961921 RepID=UPI00143903BC|nr:hypothetical protein [Natronococcus sp. JC468]NKE37551.1 hypothetical protein [Natronococcus sp. JC468]